MPRGTDFTARWTEGAWAEQQIIDAINREGDLLAVQYGITNGEAFWSSRAMAARNLPDQSQHGKRPDVLVFARAGLSHREIADIGQLYELEDAACEQVVRTAIFAIESEFSPYAYLHRLREYGKELSFTVKEEDLKPTSDWRDHFGIEVGIVQVFLDSSYLLPVSTLIGGISDGSIKRTIERSYNKAVYYTPMSRGAPFGDFENSPELIAEVLLDKYGKYTPYRRVGGGNLRLSEQARGIIMQTPRA